MKAIPATKATAPTKPVKKGSGCLAVIILVFVVLLVIGLVSSPTGGSKNASKTDTAIPAPDAEAAAKKAADDACRKELACVAEKHIAAADVYCKDPIEAQAKHDVKWTDGTFETKMSRYRWSDEKSKSAVIYIGDKASFQNGFGAYTPVTYLCTLDVDTDRVIDVKVIEGRLPTR
jgi:hypothetical protein